MLEVELDNPLPHIAALDSRTCRYYRRGSVLVRLHSEPLGLVDLPIPPVGVSAGELAGRIWAELAPRIVAHLEQDGLPTVATLPPSGLGSAEVPRCARARQAFLNDAPFVSVIVPTRERVELLERCLRSIACSDYPASRHEIIVVDNASETMATFQLVLRLSHELPHIRYVREPRSGSASARNRGLALARGDVMVITDDDVVVDRHWLTEIVRAFDLAPNVGCVTGLILPLELETPAQVWLEQYGGFSKGFARRLYDLSGNRPSEPLFPYRPAMFGSGANVAISRSVLNSIGGYDPAMGNGTPALSGEDSDMLLRTIIGGHTIAYQPAALVRHLHRRDYAGLRRQIYGYGAGLSACLVKTLLANPRLLLDFVAKLPQGLVYALHPHSPLNRMKEQDYPRELTWLERRGMLYGPLAYARSRRQFGTHRPGESPPWAPVQSVGGTPASGEARRPTTVTPL